MTESVGTGHRGTPGAPVGGTDSHGAWLVIGHGSVGSALARRIGGLGRQTAVLDPAPRVPVRGTDHLTVLDPAQDHFDLVMSCVTPSMAMVALLAVAPCLDPRSLFFDWNTVTPEMKRALGDAAPCRLIDVALLDTLDGGSGPPSLAISGPEAASARGILTELGFGVTVVGPDHGDAARLKFARSLFMKTLEALVVEFEAAIASLPARDVVMASIERNLGEVFMSFATTLLETDRLHAARRSEELAQAVEAYRADGAGVELAEAAVGVLRATARAWSSPEAPEPGSGPAALASFLSTFPARGEASRLALRDADR